MSPRSRCSTCEDLPECVPIAWSSPDPREAAYPSESQQLLRNMQCFGWSPVRLVEEGGGGGGGGLPSLLRDWSGTWKANALELFVARDAPPRRIGRPPPVAARTATAATGTFTFRTSESGDPAIVEPKQSWEYIPRRTPPGLLWGDAENIRDDGGESKLDEAASRDTASPSSFSHVTTKLERWARVLRAVADRVREELLLPPTLLSARHSLHGGDDDSCADVLRVFCYDAAVPQKPGLGPPRAVMGSSPHTDWGSLTVVHQDGVGGLQARCKACGAWKDVKPSTPKLADSSTDDAPLEFVVHVGDLTSLAIGRALLQRPQEPRAAAAGPTPASPPEGTSAATPFPSPLHRVLSPSVERRVSLVYFAYPPPHASLRELIEVLRTSWSHLPSLPHPPTGHRLPYDDYYLLRDQKARTAASAGGTNEDLDAAEKRLESILNMPVGDVLRDKWNEVQRD